MLKKLEEIKRLQNELNEEYSIINVSSFSKDVQIHEIENFIRIAKDNEIKTRSRADSEFPYGLYFEEFGFKFEIILNEEEYAEYKKSRATNTTSDEL